MLDIVMSVPSNHSCHLITVASWRLNSIVTAPYWGHLWSEHLGRPQQPGHSLLLWHCQNSLSCSVTNEDWVLLSFRGDKHILAKRLHTNVLRYQCLSLNCTVDLFAQGDMWSEYLFHALQWFAFTYFARTIIQLG